MLLKKVNKDKLKYPLYVQNKLDGLRCVCLFANNAVQM